ncbi:MAG: biopolymer transporter ExbD [Hymenobacter sp.]|nr:MAG: biopolymer transporter ExbD [Hymenobacter sp.]
MATLSTSRVSTRVRMHWHRFRLDMTPMVDVAFLLLTFFMLSTQPHVLQLQMPAARDAHEYSNCGELHHPDMVTLILGTNHQLHYYTGLNSPLDLSIVTPALHTTNFSAQGIRKLLLTWRSNLSRPTILIKPGPQATYRDMVDILDEMIITDQSRYALTDLSAADRQLLQASGRQ